MMLAALLDLGTPFEGVFDDVLKVADVDIEVKRINKGGIACNHVEVIPHGKSPGDFKDILDRIKKSGLDRDVAESSIAVFRMLAEAEGKVHGTPVEEVHFHEVADSVADVVGTCSALHGLGVESVYCTPVSVGGGTVKTAHGELPVPAPATLEVLRRSSLQWRGGPSEHELLTPTAAALLATFVTHPTEFMPPVKIECIGYGGGSLDTPHPNVLRAVIGDITPAMSTDSVVVLESNMDHAGGEVIAHAAERLFEGGALDVTLIPATMKKSRPGVVVTVIAPPEKARELARLLIKETGTLGVRMREQERIIAGREQSSVVIDVNGSTHEVGVKVARDASGSVIDVSAEYEDCRRVALVCRLTMRDVARLAESEARKTLGRGGTG